MAMSDCEKTLNLMHEDTRRKAERAYKEFLETNQSCYCGSHFALWLYRYDLDDTLREIVADWCYSNDLIGTEVKVEKTA
jgi:hypothetical protein